jgi:dipeptidyl aminopeptidase/acylaminoacyl peptidase
MIFSAVAFCYYIYIVKNRSKIIKYSRAFLILLILIYAIGSMVFAFVIIAPNKCNIGNAPANFLFPIENVSFKSTDGLTLKGWYAPDKSANKVIILLHGHKANRRSMYDRALLFRQAGYGVILYDARGCGESEGEQTSAGYKETNDLIGCINYLHSRGVTDIGCVGISQGGATILLAAEKLTEVRFVICESAYDEMSKTLDNRFQLLLHVPAKLGGIFFIPITEYALGLKVAEICPIKHIKQLKCPIMIISGEIDNRVLKEDTIHLFNEGNQPKQLWIVPKAGHWDLYNFDSANYAIKVLGFIKQYF